MKKLFLVLVMLVALNVNAQWVWQNPLPQGNNLKSVFFINEYTGWTVGDKGIILKSTDGGINWVIQQGYRPKNLRKVYFIDVNTGFTLSDTSIYYKTTNGGINWMYNSLGGNTRLNEMYFIDQNTGFMSGKNLLTYKGIIYRTTDSGISWENWYNTINWDTDFPRLDFVNNNYGVIGGGYSIYYYTTNSGINWAIKNYYQCNDFDYFDSLNGLSITGGNISKTTNGGANFIGCYTSTDTITSIYIVNANTAFCVGATKIFKTTNFGANWIVQNSGITGSLNKVFFIDSLKGWIAGNGGRILKTTNGGTNWQIISNGIYKNFLSSSFLNSNTGWVSGENAIVKTTDGGNIWTEQWNASGGLFMSIKFINENTGFVLNAPPNYLGSLYKTINGGNNWDYVSQVRYTNSSYPLSSYYYKINFINENTGFVVGSVYVNMGSYSYQIGIIYRTTNSGLNWTFYTTSNPLYYLDIDFANENTGWTVGTGNFVKKTTDAGATWVDQLGLSGTGFSGVSAVNENVVYLLGNSGGTNTYVAKTTNGGVNWTGQIVYQGVQLWNMKFVNENTGWISGENGMAFATSNGGVNWHYQITPTFEKLNLSFVDENTGWLVGNNGVILKTTNGVISGLGEISKSIPSTFMLRQNFPNPFNPTTKIKFDISKMGDVKILVYDVMGREVQTLVNEMLKPGTYEVSFDGSSLTSGVYFYRLITGGFTETKKMLMIK